MKKIHMLATKGLLSLLAVLVLAGCISRKPDAKTIRFRYWGDLAEIQIVEQMLKEFEAANPGVKVKPERKNADYTYADVLLQEFAANKAPDVIFASSDNLELLEASGKLADLNPYLSKETDLKASDYYETLIKRYTKDGKLLVLPRDIAPVAVVYYNKDLFDKAGLAYPKDEWHWEDLRAVAIKLTKRDAKGTPIQLGFADDWNLWDAWAMSAGGGVVDDYYHPTRFTLASGPSLEGILFRWKLMHDDKVMMSLADNKGVGQIGGASGMFLNGSLAMLHSGIWKTPEYRGIKSFKWDVVRFPTKKGAKDPRFWVGSSGYTMRNDVVNPELCWKLIKFMGGPEGQKRLAATGLAQPSIKSLAASPIFLDGKDPKNKKMLIYACEHGLSTPAWKPWQEYMRGTWLPKTDPIWVTDFAGDPVAVIKEAERIGNEKFFGIK